MSILQLAIIFFIVTNPIGNCPTILALIKDHSIKKQQKILLRESIFSMCIAIFFLFLGEAFLSSLNIQGYALTISGGIILFLVAFSMIFSKASDTNKEEVKRNPFIVPIATPLLSGAGLMTMVMLYSKQENDNFKILLAIFLAWSAITAVLVMTPYLQILLGKRGLSALEQLMGMLLAIIGMQMIVDGTALFLNSF